MKTLTLTPPSVTSRNPIRTWTTRMEENERSSNTSYYPGCLKDANCKCPMCLDSINATLDLVPFSPPKHPTHSPFPPKSKTKTKTKTSLANNTKRGFYLRVLLRWILLIGPVLGLELGVSLGFSRVLRPRLSAQIVTLLVEESLDVDGLNNRLMAIQQSLVDYVDHHEVSRCHLGESTWIIDKDDLIMKSRCVLHKSAAEEVVVWGWPLQTSGLLTAEFSTRSFTILSGRVIEWPEGKMESRVVREVKSSWVKAKWSESVVQLEENTWIVEYKQSMFVENPTTFSTALELFKFKSSRFMETMKRLYWVLTTPTTHQTWSTSQPPLIIPT